MEPSLSDTCAGVITGYLTGIKRCFIRILHRFQETPKNVGWQGRAERERFIPHVGESGQRLGVWGEGAEKWIRPSQTRVCLCALLPEQQMSGTEETRPGRRHSSMRGCESGYKQHAAAPLHLGQNAITASVRGASGISLSAAALRVPAGTGLSQPLVHSPGRLLCGACLSVRPPCFYFFFAARLNCTQSRGRLLRRRSPTSAPLG